MAETQKGASSSAKSKEKSSLLADLDIGNDFLNSWKSISIGDNAMDFDFGPVSTNKKAAFNFDKEDVDFNLDSSFSKISSFKIDMADLDISSPSKKNEKKKETSKEESTGANKKGKADSFNFNFDFNELDSFSFEPSLRKKDQTKKVLQMESSTETSALPGSGLPMSDDVGVLDGSMPKKNSVPEMAITSTADSMVESDPIPEPIGKNCSSNSTSNNSEASISVTVTQKAEVSKTSVVPTRNTSINTEQPDFEIEKGTSPRLIAQEAEHDMSYNSSEQELSRNAGSGLLEEDQSLGEKLSSSDVEKDLELNDGLDSSGEKAMPESLPTQHSIASQETDQESDKFENDNHNLVNNNTEGDNAQPECITIASTKDEHLLKFNEDIQGPASQPLKAPSSSGSTAQNLTQGKEDCRTNRSKFFLPPIDTTAQKQKKSLMQTKLSAVGNKRIGTSPPSQADEGMVQSGKDDENVKKAGIPVPPIDTAAQKQKKSLMQTKLSAAGNKRVGTSPPSQADERMAQNGKDDENGKKAGIPVPSPRSLPKSNTLQAGSKGSCKSLSTNMSNIRPLGVSQQSKSMAHNKENLRVLDSSIPSSTAKNNSVGGNKICPIKSGRQTLDCSSLKPPKNVSPSLNVHQSLLLKEGKTSGNLEQKTSLKGIAAQAKVTGSMATLTPKTNIIPLKRKTPESLVQTTGEMINTSPLKRLCESPSQKRVFSGITGITVGTQDRYGENQANCNKSAEYNSPQASVLHTPKAANKKELGALQTLEDDDNVNKAEAITKELEDICNMLRKKHEEAKELLVRSIVNNNKLLMLNHPMYDEKIHMVKNFAAGLMKRAIPMST